MFKLRSPLGILGVLCGLAVLTAAAAMLIPSGGQKAGDVESLLKENNIQAKMVNVNPENNLSDISKDDHAWGDLNNPVKMIIYSDFECPFCAKLAKAIEEVKKNYEGKVVIAYRHNPLVSHSAAMPAALASECAAEQGKFWEMHDKLFEDAGEKNLSAEEFKKDAGELNLNLDQFNQCLAGEKYKAKIENQAALGKQVGADGTPTFFVNGEVYPGAYPFEDYIGSDGINHEGVKSIIERHLKE